MTLGTRGRLDLPGAVLITLATSTGIYGLVRAGEGGWTMLSALLPLAAAAVLAAAFVATERALAAPLVPPRLIAARPMATGTAVMLLASGLIGT